ncbi:MULTISPECIES: hypothetical protein [unclassified Caldicellulosiruptor]|uniref:hypothetical protein n=1 Tax=Caldicellulosiruptor sp. DIB 104C TaxID=3019889 RepID=UPI0003A2AD95|nr:MULTISPECIES: hypothetical protein [unclassified Caldicellulosiruptor]
MINRKKKKEPAVTERYASVKLPEDFKILFKNYNFEMLDTEKHKELIVNYHPPEEVEASQEVW